MTKYTFASGFPDKEEKINFKFYIRNVSSWKFLDWHWADYFEVDIEDVTTEDELNSKIKENLQNILIESFLKLTLKGKTELHYKINVENIKLSLPANIELVKFKNKTTFPKSAEEIAQMQDTIGTLMNCFEKQEIVNQVEDLKQNIFNSLIDKYDDELKNELISEININDTKYLKEIVIEQLSKAMKWKLKN